jgi:hypothetical protein
MTPRFCHNVVIRLTAGFLMVLIAVIALGQSGRRGSKSPAIPVPSPEAPQPEKNPATNDIAKVVLIVGTNRNDVFNGVPFRFSDAVLASCVNRLQDSSSVLVDVVTRDMTRGDAVSKAKAAKDGFVVWLNLRGDDPSRSNNYNLEGVYIEFLVLETPTAKVRTQGNSYPGAYRKGAVVMGPSTGRSNDVIVENRLRIAAEDAAERILKALHLASTRDIPHP